MRNSLSIIIFILLIISIQACKSQKSKTKISIPIGDTSKTSLDWEGTYQGILPCADCPGIKTEIILNNDNTYKLKTNYLERGVGLDTVGKFSWNEEGNIITLDDHYPQKYLVGENRLFSLDGDGNRITGDLADRFILEKVTTKLTNKNWKLISINEEPVKSEAKQPFMVLNENENSVSGNTGCNNFFGTYELSGENKIKFSSLRMTKMACIGNNPEQEFIEVLDETANYSLSENELVLKDEDETILAIFQADYFLQ